MKERRSVSDHTTEFALDQPSLPLSPQQPQESQWQPQRGLSQSPSRAQKQRPPQPWPAPRWQE